MDDSTKRRAGRVLRFAVTGALLVGAPAACGSSTPTHTINEPAEEHVNEPAQQEPTSDEPAQQPEQTPDETIANEPATPES